MYGASEDEGNREQKRAAAEAAVVAKRKAAAVVAMLRRGRQQRQDEGSGNSYEEKDSSGGYEDEGEESDGAEDRSNAGEEDDDDDGAEALGPTASACCNRLANEDCVGVGALQRWSRHVGDNEDFEHAKVSTPRNGDEDDENCEHADKRLGVGMEMKTTRTVSTWISGMEARVL